MNKINPNNLTVEQKHRIEEIYAAACSGRDAVGFNPEWVLECLEKITGLADSLLDLLDEQTDNEGVNNETK